MEKEIKENNEEMQVEDIPDDSSKVEVEEEKKVVPKKRKYPKKKKKKIEGKLRSLLCKS
jgi:hypothetical protein